jgi:hypothetical protein
LLAQLKGEKAPGSQKQRTIIDLLGGDTVKKQEN